MFGIMSLRTKIISNKNDQKTEEKNNDPIKFKKMTLTSLIKHLEDNNVINNYLNNINNFVDMMNKNKLLATTKLFYFFIAQTKYDLNIDVCKIMTLFDKLNYEFSIDNCVHALSHGSCNLSSNNIIINGRKRNMTISNDILKMKESNLNKMFDFFGIKKLNISKILNKAIFALKNTFIDYLMKNNMHILVDREVGQLCSIIFGHLNLLQYYCDKKFIANEAHILALLHSSVLYNGLDTFLAKKILDCLLKNGTTITTNLVEPLIFFGYDSHAKLCTSLLNEDFKKIKERTDKIKIINSDFKCTGKLIGNKEKKINPNPMKSECTLNGICQFNSLVDVISYMSLVNTDLTINCYMSLMLNNDVSVFEYFIQTNNFKPNLLQIISVPFFDVRYILLKRFYPEVIKKDINNFVHDKIKMEEDNKDEKPKKVIKKVIKKVTKNLEQSEDLVDFN